MTRARPRRARLMRRSRAPAAAPRAAAVTLAFTPREVAALTEMQTQLGLATIADALGLGVWHLARHLDLDLPCDLFASGSLGRRQDIGNIPLSISS